MDHGEVGHYWDRNADTWIELSRAGYDVCRDLVNTPAFLAMLPDVTGRTGLDLGCGEGHNTCLLARRGARMTAIDLAWRFLQAAGAEERREPLGIQYLGASAVGLLFRSEAFDFVVAVMSLMDMADLDVVVAEVHRVLRPGGFLQCSIEHPCAVPPQSGWVRDEHGRRVARTIGGYFDQQPHVDSWLFSAAPRGGPAWSATVADPSVPAHAQRLAEPDRRPQDAVTAQILRRPRHHNRTVGRRCNCACAHDGFTMAPSWSPPG
jgi:SAM-dependent methyltransferase